MQIGVKLEGVVNGHSQELDMLAWWNQLSIEVKWDFDGLAFTPLAVYHSNNSCKTLSNSVIAESIFESLE